MGQAWNMTGATNGNWSDSMNRRQSASLVRALGANSILLRDVVEDDLPIFFEHQLDSSANRMAAFTAKDPTDRAAFTAKWEKISSDDTVTLKTILFEGHVAGHIASFEQSGKREITYWIGKEYWGKGIATGALSAFLGDEMARPLYARAAQDNVASLRVLEKCDFKICGHDKGFAYGRGEEVEELILKLRARTKEEAQ